MKTLLDRKYDGESIVDVSRDVHEAIEDIAVPVDEDGFAMGEYRVVITFVVSDGNGKGESDG